jgi:DNA repair protein RecO (recombination protein O)
MAPTKRMKRRRRTRLRPAPLRLERVQPDPGGAHAPLRPGRAGRQGREEAEFQLPAVLLPLQPLHIAFGGDAEIRTLKSAEWLGGQVMPTGDALLSGYYLNELLLRLLARDDPHPALFDAYAATVRCSPRMRETLQPACAPSSCCCCARSACCRAGRRRPPRWRRWTRRSATAGARGRACGSGEDEDRGSLPGAQWLALQAGAGRPAPFSATCGPRPPANELKPQLRACCTTIAACTRCAPGN